MSTHQVGWQNAQNGKKRRNANFPDVLSRFKHLFELFGLFSALTPIRRAEIGDRTVLRSSYPFSTRVYGNIAPARVLR